MEVTGDNDISQYIVTAPPSGVGGGANAGGSGSGGSGGSDVDAALRRAYAPTTEDSTVMSVEEGIRRAEMLLARDVMTADRGSTMSHHCCTSTLRV